jgi:TRAP-type uncharacterized transport system fused permease subunit
VALAAFAAAPIAKASGFKIGFQALRIALPGFVIPYMAVYDPTLMLQPVPSLAGGAYWLSVVYIVFKTALAVLLWGAASVGYLHTRMEWWERIGAAVAAAFLVLALPVTDEVGFALTFLLLGFHFLRSRRTTTAVIR